MSSKWVSTEAVTLLTICYSIRSAIRAWFLSWKGDENCWRYWRKHWRCSLPSLASQTFRERDRVKLGVDDCYFALYYKKISLNHFRHTCGGFIISQDAVITAAHCIYGRENLKFQIRAGSDLRSQGGQVVNVTKFFLHPDYAPSGLYNDIAVLRLETRLQFNKYVWATQLPPRGRRVPDGASLLVSGWGTLQWQGSSPERLQKVYVPAVSNEECARAYSNIRDHKICAGEEGLDACQGDEGIFFLEFCLLINFD